MFFLLFRSHAMAIGSVVAEIQEHAGNPEKIRMSLAQAGQRRYLEGVERQQLDMLGPVLAHVIRPLVWEKGLWSIEVEKAWTHLFDIVACLMKLGYPQEFEVSLAFNRYFGIKSMGRRRRLFQTWQRL